MANTPINPTYDTHPRDLRDRPSGFETPDERASRRNWISLLLIALAAVVLAYAAYTWYANGNDNAVNNMMNGSQNSVDAPVNGTATAPSNR